MHTSDPAALSIGGCVPLSSHNDILSPPKTRLVSVVGLWLRQPENAMPICPFFGDANDRALPDVLRFLTVPPAPLRAPILPLRQDSLPTICHCSRVVHSAVGRCDVLS